VTTFAHVLALFDRLIWPTIAAIALPAIVLVWLDYRAGRRQ